MTERRRSRRERALLVGSCLACIASAAQKQPAGAPGDGVAIAASNSTHHNATKLLHNSVVGNATAVVRLDSLEGLKSDAWFLYYALGAVFLLWCRVLPTSTRADPVSNSTRGLLADETRPARPDIQKLAA